MVVVANGRLWRSITLRSSDGSARRMADEPMTAIGRLAAAISSPARAISASGAGAIAMWPAGDEDGLGCGRERDVLRQVEMHRAHRLGHGERDGGAHRLRDAPALQPQRRLGDRLEQRVVVDPHLDAAAELVGVEIAGDGDHRRAVEPGRADAGRKIGRARAQGRDAEPRGARQAAADVGGEAGRALMGRQHELNPALAHGLHQGEHVAARDAEAVPDAGRFQGGDDQIGVVHGDLRGI